MTPCLRRIALVTFGTRGDVLPFCVLGRELRERGHDVRLVTVKDYHDTAGRFGLEPVETGPAFAEVLSDPRIENLFRNYLSVRPSVVPQLFTVRRALIDRFRDIVAVTLDEVRGCDLVAFNPFAYFAGLYAQEFRRPAVRVMCQPLLPSRKTSLCLLGGRSFGGLANRLSYEPLRILSPLSAGAFAQVRRRHGLRNGPGFLTNPLTAGLRATHHLAAYSPALSPDPGDWPVPVTATGPWYPQPQPEARLQDYLEAFLAAGPPPVYVGFGSMLWGGKRHTEIVLKALDIWGGRAIVNIGSDSLRIPNWPELPPHIQATTHADHSLLFPRCAAVVHHGGAGTTAAALRAGRPNVVLPLLGDQLYWGRRVAAVGAAEAPMPLRHVTPADLAGRIARACSEAAFAEAASRMARAMADEPGVAAGADLIESLLPRTAVAEG